MAHSVSHLSLLAHAHAGTVCYRARRAPPRPVRAPQLRGLRPLLYVRAGTPRVVRRGGVTLDIHPRPTHILARRVPPVLDNIQHTQLYPRVPDSVERVCVLRGVSLPTAACVSCSVCPGGEETRGTECERDELGRAAALFRTLGPTTRSSCACTRVGAHVQRTRADRTSGAAVAAGGVLGGGVVGC